MKRLLVFALVAPLFAAVASAQSRCDASINGYHIRTVYITGSQYNGVAWAYKHIAEASCLVPTTDLSKADAILDIVSNTAPNSAADSEGQSDSIVVTCSSGIGSSSCIDSDGNELDTLCDGAGNCSSYYGPSPVAAALHGLAGWARGAWYQSEAILYTPDKKIIWRSDAQKGATWHDLWPDKLREGTGSPVCARNAFSAHRFKNYRQWASERCGVVFQPLVSIDIRANSRIAAKQNAVIEKQAQADDMRRNAQRAAAKQAQSASNP